MVDHVDLDGVRTWHEVRGEGAPVVLHGGFSDSGEFDAGLVHLEGRVHRYDRRGHGRTPDVAGPLDPAVFARDLEVYLQQVVGGPAALVGYSDGAAVALATTLRRPTSCRAWS